MSLRSVAHTRVNNVTSIAPIQFVNNRSERVSCLQQLLLLLELFFNNEYSFSLGLCNKMYVRQ